MKLLVTGAAGFVGMHVASRLLARGDQVAGIDDLNDYPDAALKRVRLRQLAPLRGFTFHRVDIADAAALAGVFVREAPEAVVHLAAQPGVRHSFDHPQGCAAANLNGFLHVLEGCRRHGVRHLVFASSSSVYGGNTRLPYTEDQHADHPVSLYAATKRANELMAHAYSQAFALPATGARLFTVYGPWGRPDMAVFRFAQAITEGRPIELYNAGRMVRDFTYVDDVAESLVRLLDKPATPSPDFDPSQPDPGESTAPFRVFNVGGGQAVPLLRMVELLEEALGRRAERRLLPMQAGDVPATQALCSRLQDWIGTAPETPLREGLRRFAAWYLAYRGTREGVS